MVEALYDLPVDFLIEFARKQARRGDQLLKILVSKDIRCSSLPVDMTHGTTTEFCTTVSIQSPKERRIAQQSRYKEFVWCLGVLEDGLNIGAL